MKGIKHVSLLNPFSIDDSNFADIINKYYMFSGLNVYAINLKWSNNVANEDNNNISILKDMISEMYQI